MRHPPTHEASRKSALSSPSQPSVNGVPFLTVSQENPPHPCVSTLDSDEIAHRAANTAGVEHVLIKSRSPLTFGTPNEPFAGGGLAKDSLQLIVDQFRRACKHDLAAWGVTKSFLEHR
jgi:hypothetical protein